MSDPDRYLKNRNGKWYYVRRIPGHVQDLAGQSRISLTLKTESLETARVRRDAMEEADAAYWAKLLAQSPAEQAEARYEADKARCMALGYVWKSLDHLVAEAAPEELVSRVLSVGRGSDTSRTAKADALLGTARRPTIAVSKALEVFLAEIAPDLMRNKSPQQKRTYEKVKQRAVNNFIEICGDKGMADITREDAVKFHGWWQKRVTGEVKPKCSPNSGNRDVGNMRKLFDDYFKHIGEDDLPNPFRNLRFRERKIDKKKRPAFPVDWIRDRILHPDTFRGLNRQASGILLVLIETGCRPSEICNLPAHRIHSDAKVPFIEIEFQEKRELKTESSIRRIPLVGVAFEAMKLFPEGFPRYHDKEENFSQIARKHFRAKGLFPTEDHVIYSLRHSFEDRMKEGRIDPEIRKFIFGHSIDREEYGEGASLQFLQGELQRIALPYSKLVLPVLTE
ncbi:MAG: hypothetical protein NXI02_29870 [Rhodobacteraceae bacterium]|nr:hypothetical protein [Paracoccaceae bacterium]